MAPFGWKLSVNTHCNTGHSYGQHEGQISSDEEQLNMKGFFFFLHSGSVHLQVKQKHP